MHYGEAHDEADRRLARRFNTSLGIRYVVLHTLKQLFEREISNELAQYTYAAGFPSALPDFSARARILTGLRNEKEEQFLAICKQAGLLMFPFLRLT